MLEDIDETKALYVIVPFVVVGLYLTLHRDLTTPMMVLFIASAVCLFIILSSLKSEKEKKKRSADGKSDENSIKDQIFVKPTDGADTVVAKLKLCQSLEESPIPILEAIRKICRRKGAGKATREFINTALDLNLHKHVLECVIDKPPHTDSALFGLCGDILIDLFRKQAADASSASGEVAHVALGCLKGNKAELRELVDGIIQFLQGQLRKLKQMDGVMNNSSGAQQPFYAASGELSNGSVSPADSTSPSSAPASPHSFAANGYKFVMLLGFLSMDSSDAGSHNAQSLIGDRGGVQVALDYLNYFYASRVEYVKWCSWSLIHMTYANPPNKVEFVNYGGVMAEIKCLRHHTDMYLQRQKQQQAALEVQSPGNTADAATYYQVLGLLCSLLTPDAQAKTNLAHLRQLVLSQGIVDLTDAVLKQTRTVSAVPAAEKPPSAVASAGSLNDIDCDSDADAQPAAQKLVEDQRLAEVVSSLLEVIMSDWS